MTDLGSRLRNARCTRGAEQKDVAARAGLADGRTLWRFETGRAVPSLEQLGRLAVVLEVEIGWLVTGDADAGKSVAKPRKRKAA